ncbi:hypothetical protein [Nonomuraea rhodomycinica]|uniref:Beta-lactamase enzyme family protein n=1 Tax=Nonomuraea rhodomycinica TaxID=1712872 RepID=A0A7Y6IQR9_9ACTN|nr:hypothetical protein [Nonomuraea rhodomycinica]NUW42642.1 hypothetical protein [Nonomuraea rhodomycinica]
MGFDELLRELQPGAGAQAAGIRRGYGGPPPRSLALTSGPDRLRCASLLKPLYAWATAELVGDHERWRRHAEPAVVVSSNADTLALWLSAGPRAVLDGIHRRTGVRWAPPNGDPSRFGSVEVSAAEVAAAYVELAQAALAGEPVAGAILEWMRLVGGDQTFGAREALAAPEAAVKCGWYGGMDETFLRTHAVGVLTPEANRVVVVVGMTAQPYTDELERDIYQARVAEGLPVEAEHEKAGGALLRGLLRTTLTELGETPDG